MSILVAGFAMAILGSALFAAILQHLYDAVHYGQLLDHERERTIHRGYKATDERR